MIFYPSPTLYRESRLASYFPPFQTHHHLRLWGLDLQTGKNLTQSLFSPEYSLETFFVVNCCVWLPEYFAVCQPVPTEITLCPKVHGNTQHGWGHHLIPHTQWRQHSKVTRTWGASNRLVSKIRRKDSPHSSGRCAPTIVLRGGVPAPRSSRTSHCFCSPEIYSFPITMLQEKYSICDSGDEDYIETCVSGEWEWRRGLHWEIWKPHGRGLLTWQPSFWSDRHMEKVSPIGLYSLSCKFSDGPLHGRHTSSPLFPLDHFIAPTPNALNSALEVWGKSKAGKKQWQEDEEGKHQLYISSPAKKLLLLQKRCPQHLRSRPAPTRTHTQLSSQVRGWLPAVTWAHFNFLSRSWHHPFRIYIAIIHPIHVWSD